MEKWYGMCYLMFYYVYVMHYAMLYVMLLCYDVMLCKITIYILHAESATCRAFVPPFVLFFQTLSEFLFSAQLTVDGDVLGTIGSIH